MKTKKLNGFGSLGVEVQDINLSSCSDEDLKDLGKIVMDQLVVSVGEGACGLSLARLNYIATVFGSPVGDVGIPAIINDRLKEGNFSEYDLITLKGIQNVSVGIENFKGMMRVTGMKNTDGEYMGMFATGELDWHSDRQATGDFSPLVMLYAESGTEGTCTDFLQTADAYELLSPEWKKTLENLTGIHYYQPGKMAPGLNRVQDNLLRINMCPIDNSEVPVVCMSPGGRKGVRLSYNTIKYFKGYSEKESQEILEFINTWFIKDEYAYRQNWKDGQLIFMDQTITVHRRPTKDCSKRVLYRQTCNFDNLTSQKTQGIQNIGYEEPGIVIDGKKLSYEEFKKNLSLYKK